MVINRIDNDTVCKLLAWPETFAPGLPPGLWLPADPEDEAALVGELGARWSSYRWGGLGTWGSTPVVPDRDFSSRFGGLHRETIAASRFTTPRGRIVSSQWADLDSRSPELHAFFTTVRRGGGLGSCLVVLGPDAGAQAWYAPSIALVHRAVTALERPPGVDGASTDWSTTLGFVSAAASAGFAALVPLNYHPWGGCVVLGDDNLLAALAGSLLDPLPGLAAVSPQDVMARAGGLAL